MKIIKTMNGKLLQCPHCKTMNELYLLIDGLIIRCPHCSKFLIVESYEDKQKYRLREYKNQK